MAKERPFNSDKFTWNPGDIEIIHRPTRDEVETSLLPETDEQAKNLLEWLKSQNVYDDNNNDNDNGTDKE